MRSVLAAALLCAPQPPGAVAAALPRDAMTSQGFLKLADDAFFDPQLSLQPAMDALMSSGFEGVALDAPATVDLGARATLPAATLAVLRTTAAWDWMFHEHTLVVASDVDRFRCLAAAVAPPKRPVLRPSRNPPPPDHKGKVGARVVIDARERLRLPWEPATWQLLLVTRDLRSAPARVTLRKSPGPAAAAPAPLPGAELTIAASGKGLDTVLDVKLKVRAPRTVFPPAASGEVAVPVTFVVTGHARPAPYLGQAPARGRFGPAGQPEHVVATLRAPLREIVPDLAVHGPDVFYVWAFAGDQVGAPVRIDAGRP